MCATDEGLCADGFDFGGQLAPEQNLPASAQPIRRWLRPSEPELRPGLPSIVTRDNLALSMGTGKANAHSTRNMWGEQTQTVMVHRRDPGVREAKQAASSAGFRRQPTQFGEFCGEFSRGIVPTSEGPGLPGGLTWASRRGLELQREMADAKRQLPIIFITDMVTFHAVQAMKVAQSNS